MKDSTNRPDPIGSVPVRLDEHSREDQARVEVGHTDISPVVAWFMIGFFLLVIVGVPALQLFKSPSENSPRQQNLWVRGGSGNLPRL